MHLGGNTIVPVKNVIAILDMESAISKDTAEFLRVARDEGFVVSIADEEQKSLVLCDERGACRVYLSPISSLTLMRRCGYISDIGLSEGTKGI